MKLIEVFESWQGEGPDSGRKMLITRFRKCSRIEEGRVCPWCDTLVKMKVSCEADYDIKNIQEGVFNTGGLMITGGEPSFLNNLEDTIQLLNECDFEVCNIETNGYNIKDLIDNLPKDKFEKIKIMYSPKFFDLRELQIEIKKISTVISHPRVYLKFVDDRSGLLIDCLREVNGMEVRADQLWIMPEGKTCSELIDNSSGTIDICDRFNANFSSRNHIIYNFI